MIEFSVLVPVFNTPAQWLREAVESILQQEGASFELILVDDGSTDPATVAELERLRCAPGNQEVTLLSTMPENRGVGAAMQHALQLARGRYATALGSDDVMMPDRLAEQAGFMRRNGIDLLSGQVLYADADGVVRGASNWENRRTLRFTQRLFDQTVAFDREVALALGGFPQHKRVAEATWLWSRWESTHGLSRTCVGRPFWAIYRLHDRSLSHGRRGPAHLRRWSQG